MTTTQLREKAKAATGPDRELDAALSAFLCGGRVAKDQVVFPGTYWDENQGHRISEKLTASIDAALALVERKCPGMRISMDQMKDGWDVDLSEPGNRHGVFSATAKTLPLAIILALLAALSEHPQ